MFDRIVSAFNRSGATRAVAFYISKAPERVWDAGLLHKLISYWFSGQTFGLISSFLSNRQLLVVLDGKSSQEYPFSTLELLKGPLFVLHFSYYTLMTFLMMLSDIAVYANDTALYYKPFFSIWVFFHEHSRITGLQGKGKGISLTPHYLFHPLHRHCRELTSAHS